MLNKANKLIVLLEDGLLVFTLSSMILLALTQIVLRNVFGMGLEWSEPLLRVMVLWLGLLGALAATRKNQHITIDVLSRKLSPKLKAISCALSSLFSSVVCGIITYYSIQFVIMEYEDGMMAFSNVPAWVCEIIIPIGFGLMALRFFINCFRPNQMLNRQPA